MTELRQRWEREKTQLRTAARAESKAEDILAVLQARGMSVSETVRKRVLGCNDVSLLDRWLIRAATATSDTDIIAA